MPTRSAVYRFYDADDNLLYIGSSKQLDVRYKDHAKKKPWWPDVHRKTETWYPTRERAYAAERGAIQTERPKYNVNDQIPELTDLEKELMALGDQFKHDREALDALRKRCQEAVAECRATGISVEKIAWHLRIEKNTAAYWLADRARAARRLQSAAAGTPTENTP